MSWQGYPQVHEPEFQETGILLKHYDHNACARFSLPYLSPLFKHLLYVLEA